MRSRLLKLNAVHVMGACRLFLITFLLLSRTCHSDKICEADRECYHSDDIFCDDINCNLTCIGTQSCSNLNYFCNSTNPLSTCNIQCDGYQSCQHINIYSTATKTTLNCLNWPSCIDASMYCNASSETNSNCSVYCESSRSCESFSFQCSATMNECNLQCINEPDSCSNVNFDCNGLSTSCVYDCPSEEIDHYCSNLQCPNCNNSSTIITTTNNVTISALRGIHSALHTFIHPRTNLRCNCRIC